MKNVWMIGVALGALLPGTAIAQQTVTPDAAARAQDPQDANVRNDEGLADIIVTANKQASNLQKTSGAIATVSGDSLVALGVVNTQTLNKLVSGLQIEASGSIYIRGVGSRSISATADPAVAFSVDGVYYSRVSGTSSTLFDLSRIEVVKGPQGTLYGRNATGGAVDVITNHPVIGARTLDGQIEVGDYNDIRTDVAANLPLGDNAALRIAGQTSYHKGYLSDGGDDDNTKAVRASVLLRPSPGVTFYLSGDYAHVGGQGPGAVAVGPGSNGNVLKTRFVDPSNPWAGLNSAASLAFISKAAPPTAIATGQPGIYCSGTPLVKPVPANPAGLPATLNCFYPAGFPTNYPTGSRNNEYYGLNATLNADVGFGSLTAIGGYRGSRVRDLIRGNPAYTTDDNQTDQFSGEVRVVSKPNSGPLKWIVGGFYLHEKQDIFSSTARNNQAVGNPSPVAGSPLPASTCVAPLTATTCIAQVTVQAAFLVTDDPDIVNETYAGFGEATLSVFDRLRLIGGLRYTTETKSETDGVVTTIYTLPVGVTTSFPSEGSVTYHKLNYRAGLEFDVAPRSMFYASISTAYHAGGFNQGLREGPNPYEILPEDVTSYTVGIKNRFFDNKLQVNAEGFWLDYKNYQQQTGAGLNDGSVACNTLKICPMALATTNAAAARIRGVEGDIVFAPARNTTLNVNVLYTDAEFLKFSQMGTSYAGRRIPGTIPWTITGGVNQVFPLANGGKLVANAQSQFRSNVYMWFSYSPAVYQKAYTRTDLNLTYDAPGGSITVGAFVRNVENNATLVSGAPNDFTVQAVYTAINPPRTYGAILGFHF